MLSVLRHIAPFTEYSLGKGTSSSEAMRHGFSLRRTLFGDIDPPPNTSMLTNTIVAGNSNLNPEMCVFLQLDNLFGHDIIFTR